MSAIEGKKSRRHVPAFAVLQEQSRITSSEGESESCASSGENPEAVGQGRRARSKSKKLRRANKLKPRSRQRAGSEPTPMVHTRLNRVSSRDSQQETTRNQPEQPYAVPQDVLLRQKQQDVPALPPRAHKSGGNLVGLEDSGCEVSTPEPQPRRASEPLNPKPKKRGKLHRAMSKILPWSKSLPTSLHGTPEGSMENLTIASNTSAGSSCRDSPVAAPTQGDVVMHDVQQQPTQRQPTPPTQPQPPAQQQPVIRVDAPPPPELEPETGFGFGTDSDEDGDGNGNGANDNHLYGDVDSCRRRSHHGYEEISDAEQDDHDQQPPVRMRPKKATMQAAPALGHNLHAIPSPPQHHPQPDYPGHHLVVPRVMSLQTKRQSTRELLSVALSDVITYRGSGVQGKQALDLLSVALDTGKETLNAIPQCPPIELLQAAVEQLLRQQDQAGLGGSPVPPVSDDQLGVFRQTLDRVVLLNETTDKAYDYPTYIPVSDQPDPQLVQPIYAPTN